MGSSTTRDGRCCRCKAWIPRDESSISEHSPARCFRLRVGYLIVPKSLAPAFMAAKWLSDLHSSTLEQQSLAEFLTTGRYERHLRRLRRRNTARREALRHAVHKYLGERVALTGDGSRAHVVLWPTKRVSEDAAIAQAAS